MAEESVDLSENEDIEALYQPLRLAPQDRRVTLGEYDYEVLAEIETDLFEIASQKGEGASPLYRVNEMLLPLLVTDKDLYSINVQIQNRQLRPVQVMQKFSPIIEKLAAIIEARTKSIEKKRRELPK